MPDHHDLLRLPKPPPDFIPANALPSAAFFRLSSDEKTIHGGNGRLSVWDEALTSVEQAKALRRADGTLVLRGRCGQVLEAGARCNKDVGVEYEPLDLPDAQRPGAAGHAGHAGIVGLERPAGDPKKQYRELREAIADCFSLV